MLPHRSIKKVMVELSVEIQRFQWKWVRNWPNLLNAYEVPVLLNFPRLTHILWLSYQDGSISIKYQMAGMTVSLCEKITSESRLSLEDHWCFVLILYIDIIRFLLMQMRSILRSAKRDETWKGKKLTIAVPQRITASSTCRENRETKDVKYLPAVW
jgi:hypothetical protein